MNRPRELQDMAESLLDAALSKEIKLSEDDSVYDFDYIRQKLAKLSEAMEWLSDRSIELTKISLEVSRQKSEYNTLLRITTLEYKHSPVYEALSRSERPDWLESKLQDVLKSGEEWSLTAKFLDEVRGVLGDRVQLMKRLDSDLRLQQKLIDVGVYAGATGAPPRGKKSEGVGELDID